MPAEVRFLPDRLSGVSADDKMQENADQKM
jgi:hypothetical protein